VPDGHLVGWLLNLDLLEGDKAAALDLHDQLALGLVLHASAAGALHLWVELARVYDLVDFEATDIAGIDGYLDTGLHIGAAGHNTLDSD